MLTAQHYFSRRERGDRNVLIEAMESAETIYIDGVPAKLDDQAMESAKTIYIDGVRPSVVGDALQSGQSVRLVFADSSHLEIHRVGDGTYVGWGFKGWNVETRPV